MADASSNERREALKRKAKLMTKLARTISSKKESTENKVEANSAVGPDLSPHNAEGLDSAASTLPVINELVYVTQNPNSQSVESPGDISGHKPSGNNAAINYNTTEAGDKKNPVIPNPVSPNLNPVISNDVNAKQPTSGGLPNSSTLSIIEGLVLVLICGFSEGVIHGNSSSSGRRSSCQTIETKGISKESFMILLHEVYKLDLIKLLLSKSHQKLNYNKTLVQRVVPSSSGTPGRSSNSSSSNGVFVRFPQCLLDAKKSLLSKGLIENCCGDNDFVNMNGNEVSRTEFENNMDKSSSLTASVIDSFMSNFEVSYYQSVRNIEKIYDVRSGNKWYDYKQFLGKRNLDNQLASTEAKKKDRSAYPSTDEQVRSKEAATTLKVPFSNRIRLTEKGSAAFYSMSNTTNSFSEFVLSNMLISPSYHVSSSFPSSASNINGSRNKVSSFDYVSIFKLEEITKSSSSSASSTSKSSTQQLKNRAGTLSNFKRGHELIGCLSMWYDMNSLQYVISPKQAHIVKYPELLNERIIKKKIMKTFINISKSAHHLTKKERLAEEAKILNAMDTYIIDVSRKVLPARRCLLSFHQNEFQMPTISAFSVPIPSPISDLQRSNNSLQLKAKFISLHNVYQKSDSVRTQGEMNKVLVKSSRNKSPTTCPMLSKDGAVGMKIEFALPFFNAFQPIRQANDAVAPSQRLVDIKDSLQNYSTLQLAGLFQWEKDEEEGKRLVISSSFNQHFGDITGCRRFYTPHLQNVFNNGMKHEDVSITSSLLKNALLSRPSFFITMLVDFSTVDDAKKHSCGSDNDDDDDDDDDEDGDSGDEGGSGSEEDSSDGEYLDSDSEGDTNETSSNHGGFGSRGGGDGIASNKYIHKLLNPHHDENEVISHIPLSKDQNFEYTLHLSSYGALIVPSSLLSATAWSSSFLQVNGHKPLSSSSLSSTITTQSSNFGGIPSEEDHVSSAGGIKVNTSDVLDENYSSMQQEEGVNASIKELWQEDGVWFKAVTLYGELALSKKLLSNLSANVQLTKHKIVYSSSSLQSKSVQQRSSSLFSSKQYLLKLLIDYKYEFHNFTQSSWIYSFYVYNYNKCGCLPGIPVPRAWLFSFEQDSLSSKLSLKKSSSSSPRLTITNPTLLLKIFIFAVIVAVCGLFLPRSIIYMMTFILTAVYELPVLKFIISYVNNRSLANSSSVSLLRFLSAKYCFRFVMLVVLVSFGPLCMLSLLFCGSFITSCVSKLNWFLLIGGLTTLLFFYYLSSLMASKESESDDDNEIDTSHQIKRGDDVGEPVDNAVLPHGVVGSYFDQTFAHLRVRGDLCVGDYIQADQAAIFTANLQDEYHCLLKSVEAHKLTFSQLTTDLQTKSSSIHSSQPETTLNKLLSDSLADTFTVLEKVQSELASLSRWSKVLTANAAIYQNIKIQHSNNRDENVIFMFLTLFISCGNYIGFLFGFIINACFYINESPDRMLNFMVSTFWNLVKGFFSSIWHILFRWGFPKVSRRTSKQLSKSPNKYSLNKKIGGHAVTEIIQLVVEVGKPFIINLWDQYKPNSAILMAIVFVIIAVVVRSYM